MLAPEDVIRAYKFGAAFFNLELLIVLTVVLFAIYFLATFIQKKIVKSNTSIPWLTYLGIIFNTISLISLVSLKFLTYSSDDKARYYFEYLLWPGMALAILGILISFRAEKKEEEKQWTMPLGVITISISFLMLLINPEVADIYKFIILIFSSKLTIAIAYEAFKIGLQTFNIIPTPPPAPILPGMIPQVPPGVVP